MMRMKDMNLMIDVKNIREYFQSELKAERFTTDKTGAKTIEMLGASFIANEPAIFGTPVKSYIDAELAWYESGSNKLHMVSQMRSNDVVFGYKNDYAWAQHLMDRAIDNLNEETYNLTKGDLIWQVMNLHVYERHFDLVKG